jgi:hypothetical protein
MRVSKSKTTPMKTTYWPSLGLTAVLVAGFCPLAHASLFSDNYEMLVVAETAKDAAQPQGASITYSAIDGGYIEAGDPIVGDTPPTADRVRQALFDAMRTQGFTANRTGPSELLTYYWGVLRPDRQEIRLPYGVKSNLNARLRLVSTEELGSEVENHILGRQRADGMNMNVSSPPLLVGPTASVVQNARRPRIFVIISAFDYASLAKQHEVKPLWRVKLSAQETSGDMDQVIPSLISMGAQYFGKNMQEPRIVQAALSTNASGSTSASLLQPAPETNLDSQLVGSLLNQERIEFSGANPRSPN